MTDSGRSSRGSSPNRGDRQHQTEVREQRDRSLSPSSISARDSNLIGMGVNPQEYRNTQSDNNSSDSRQRSEMCQEQQNIRETPEQKRARLEQEIPVSPAWKSKEVQDALTQMKQEAPGSQEWKNKVAAVIVEYQEKLVELRDDVDFLEKTNVVFRMFNKEEKLYTQDTQGNINRERQDSIEIPEINTNQQSDRVREARRRYQQSDRVREARRRYREAMREQSDRRREAMRRYRQQESSNNSSNEE